MKIIFRVDASLKIGTGHVMRCLTLAEMLRQRGAECRFVCRDHKGNMVEYIRQHLFDVCLLPFEFLSSSPKENTYYSEWLGSNWVTDAVETRLYAGVTLVDWVIVDHYALDLKWERELRAVCHRIMVIDDLADREHDCDFLLDQNLGRTAQDYSSLVPHYCKIFLGPKYALLRPEFASLREQSLSRRVQSKLEHVLISMGGVDIDNVTERIIEALVDAPLLKSCRFTVVMGPHAPWLEKVRRTAAALSFNIEIKTNVHNMAQLMQESNLAIGAAGSTSWERCCLGLPSLIGVVANNQTFIANSLEEAGAAKIFIVNQEMSPLVDLLSALAKDPTKMINMSTCAANITDGLGANLISDQLVDR